MEIEFRRSSRCEDLAQTDCVEVGSAGGQVAVRDSKNLDGGILRLPRSAFTDAIRAMRA